MATRDNLKEVRIGKGIMISAAQEHALQKKPGGSNVGEYKDVRPEDFAGNACGVPGSFPIDNIDRARSALALAHNAKDPDCIKRQVYKKYPELKPDTE